MTSLRILVVEDDDALREVYVDLLRSEGHEVRTASDGLQAQALLDDDIDLVITDLNMPNMSGDVFLQELRNTRRLTELPVLVVTAFPGDLPRSLTGPKTGVLRKPFELDAFTGYVHAVADGAARGNGHDRR